MIVYSMDPGKQTGWATYDTATDVWQAGVLPWQESCDWAVDAAFRVRPDLFVCESFTISKRTLTQGADHTWPTGGIGVAKWACAKAGVPFELQNPGDAKSIASDAVLRRLGWYTPGVDHPRDATRHLILGLVRHQAIDLGRLSGTV